MFAELLPCLTSLTLVKSFHPRAADPETLVAQAEAYGKPVEIIPDVADAVLSLTKRAGPDDLILVAGSIFVAAGARIAWLSTGVVNEKPE
jgi:dihydropteroate synthase